MKNYKFILSGGGTGGHIYPAIAIADALKAKYPQAEFLFVGSQDRMEMEKVPKEIIEQYLIEYENGDVEMFKKSQIKNKRNIFSRKIGEKPSPSLSSLRKK